MIYEPRNRIEVVTPKGNGIILFVTDYGHETDTIYTVVIDDSGDKKSRTYSKKVHF